MPGNPDLFDDDDAPRGDDVGTPSGFFDAVSDAGAKRGAGRPLGARNKKTEAFEKWFYAKGYRDPAQVLAEIITMDPRALQAMAAENAEGLPKTKVGDFTMVQLPSLAEIVDLQRKAAVDLMPYLHGKKPTEVVVTDERLPTLMIFTDSNQIAEARRIEGQRLALSLGTPLVEAEANEINDLGESEK